MAKIIENAHEIINKLSGDTKTGECSCPVAGHGQGRGDRKPSLWISPEGKGLKCHAGCSYKSVVAAIRALGIEVQYEGTRPTKPILPPLNADLDEAQRFFDLLDPEAKTWTFQTFSDDGKHPKQATILHGTLAEHAAQLKKLSRYGAGIFVCPNVTDGKGRKRENIVAIRAVSVDLDGSPLEPVQQCELKPHVIVETSPGRYQAHWRVKGLSLDEFVGITLGIAKRFHGDAQIAELAHCCRLPGFEHAKDPSNRFQVQIVGVNKCRPYTAVEIRKAFPPAVKSAASAPKPKPIESPPLKARREQDVLKADEYWAQLMGTGGAPKPGPEQEETPSETAKSLADKVEALGGPADAETSEGDDSAADEPQRVKQVDVLIGLTADADLFHNDDRGYADIAVDGHRETWPIKSRGFRDWLLHRYYKQTETAPTGEALRLAVDTIGARARFDAPAREVFVRVGGHDGKIYLDLCDEEWRVVEVDAKGWRVISDAPVRFTRAGGMLPLPVPVKGGSVEDLRPFVNVKRNRRQKDRALDPDFILLVALLLALLRDCGPYPILIVMGEEGSAKTTLLQVIRALVDPSKIRERRLPREELDLFIAAKKAHVVSFGNVSHIPDWLSDALCSLSTGGGFGKRALYTDEDEILFEAMRPVQLNGIEFTTRSDLADRSIFLKLPPIGDKKRRREKQLWEEFERKRPGILGALLDVVAHGLRALPKTPIDPDYPRMADFAHWIAACEGALWWEPGAFKRAYADNRASANLDVVEGETVATAVLRMMDNIEEEEETAWTGTASELLSRLEVIVGEKEAKRRHWPGSAAALSARLKRIAPRLRKLGVRFSRGRKGGGHERTITLRRDDWGREQP